MKKYKLKGWVKVVLSIIVFVVSAIIYLKVDSFGVLAQTHKGYLLICIAAWFWLLTGQIIALAAIWEE